MKLMKSLALLAELVLALHGDVHPAHKKVVEPPKFRVAVRSL